MGKELGRKEESTGMDRSVGWPLMFLISLCSLRNPKAYVHVDGFAVGFGGGRRGVGEESLVP